MFEKAIENYYSIAITGICKNAGKTTVLNRLLADCSGISVALTSVGYDGEQTDRVSGTRKPQIFVDAGTIVITAEQTLERCTFTKEILLGTAYDTPLGRIAVVRALSGGVAEIAGPSVVGQLKTVSALVRCLGCEKFFIDGAIGRKTMACNSVAEGVVLSSGASYSDSMQDTVEQSALLAELIELKSPDSTHIQRQSKNSLCEPNLNNNAFESGERIVKKQLLTDDGVEKVLEDGTLRGCTLLFEDFTKIFISQRSAQRLRHAGIRLAVQNPANLIAVTANPYSTRGASYDGEAFLRALKARMPHDKVANVEKNIIV
ncbi:MAG: hypothetical protein PHX51_04530 [Clostridia bacterium]|nr:hypothetical protein [Clostridia bacterium]